MINSYKKFLESNYKTNKESVEENFYKTLNNEEFRTFYKSHEKISFTKDEYNKIYKIWKDKLEWVSKNRGPEIIGLLNDYIELGHISKFNDEWYIVYTINGLGFKHSGGYVICDQFKGLIHYLKYVKKYM